MEAERLTGYIRGLGQAAVAFSGGVDSSVVAAAAFRALGPRAIAVTVSSQFVTPADMELARAVAAGIGITHLIAEVDALGNDLVASNPPDRCYHCKSDDFSAIKKIALENGIHKILDGTNADDPKGRRPGLKALGELGVISPLLELGIGKEEVRRIAVELNLANHDRPSSPCLASRFPYGARITAEGLSRVGAAEEFIRGLGVRLLRVRDHGNTARIEAGVDSLPLLIEPGVREKIVAKLHSLGYNYVALDLDGFRSGSMDIGIPPGE